MAFGNKDLHIFVKNVIRLFFFYAKFRTSLRCRWTGKILFHEFTRKLDGAKFRHERKSYSARSNNCVFFSQQFYYKTFELKKKVSFQLEENRGLRLKESIRQNLVINDDIRSESYNASYYQTFSETPQDTSIKVVESFFDEAGYVAGGTLKPGEDPYGRNKFNQLASDRIASNREIPDTRMSQ